MRVWVNQVNPLGSWEGPVVRFALEDVAEPGLGFQGNLH